MPTAAPPPSSGSVLEAQMFWERFKSWIIAALIVVLLAAAGFAGYRFYSDRRAASASALLASATNVKDFQQIIVRFPNTPAGADAYILLAEAQRSERNYAEANATLRVFIAKNPNHELVSTARMAMAANLESMGTNHEALSTYQQIAATYPNSFNAPLALLSQVYILKALNRDEEARRICETILTQYRESFWAEEAMQQLQLLKPSRLPAPITAQTVPPLLERSRVAQPQAAPTAKPK